MAILSINRIPDSGGGATAIKTDGLQFTEKWRITTDAPVANLFSITTDVAYIVSGIPQTFGEPYSGNIFYTNRGVSLNREGLSKYHWIAEATWSAAPLSQDEKEKTEYPNPLDRRTRFSIDAADFERYATKDANDKAYNNSAGQPLETQIHEDARIVIHVEKNVTGWTTGWFALKNTVNDGAVTITDGYSTLSIASEKGYLKPLRMSSLQQENDYKYYTLSAEIHVEPGTDGWKRLIKNQGFNWKGGDGLVRFRVKKEPYASDTLAPADADYLDKTEPSPEEQLLAADGTALFDINGDATGGGSVPTYEEFEPYKVSSWSSLPFFS